MSKLFLIATCLAVLIERSSADTCAMITYDMYCNICADLPANGTVTPQSGACPGFGECVDGVCDAPKITLLGTDPVSVWQDETYTDAGATALDFDGSDITSEIVIFNPVITHTPGTYSVSYFVSVYSVITGIASYAVATRTVNVESGKKKLYGQNPTKLFFFFSFFWVGYVLWFCFVGPFYGAVFLVWIRLMRNQKVEIFFGFANN